MWPAAVYHFSSSRHVVHYICIVFRDIYLHFRNHRMRFFLLCILVIALVRFAVILVHEQLDLRVASLIQASQFEIDITAYNDKYKYFETE